MSVPGVDWSILWPALLAGLLVLASHVPMGMQVLQRGIVFIDLAIAQIAGVGVIAADAMGLEPHGWAVQVAALSAALIASRYSPRMVLAVPIIVSGHSIGSEA